MCKDLSFRRTLQSTSSARHKTVKPLIHHGWTEWQRKNRQLRHTSDFNLQRLIEKPALGSKWCLPRKENHHPLRSQSSTRFKCKPQAPLLEEDRVVSSLPPSLSSAIFNLYASLIHYVFSRCCAPFYTHLPTNRERGRMKLRLSTGSNCIKGSPGQPWRTLQRGWGGDGRKGGTSWGQRQEKGTWWYNESVSSVHNISKYSVFLF